MARKLLALLIVFFSLFNMAYAEDLGAVDKTYPIIEENPVNAIRQHYEKMLKDGAIARIHKRMQDEVRQYAETPPPVHGLRPATHDITYFYDPSITLSRDIRGVNGQILYKKGTRVNPLDHVSLTSPLLFFDASNKSQMNWVEKKLNKISAIRQKEKKYLFHTKMTNHRKLSTVPKTPVLIMVGGNVVTTTKLLNNRRIFFDQYGVLVRKLHIKYTPAFVSQQGEYLRIDEIAVKK